MKLFLTSSPCIPNADRAILNPTNGFVNLMTACLPEHPQCLFICSNPDTPELTDRFADDIAGAFAEAGIVFADLAVLDGRNQEDAAALIAESDLIVLAGGHVPTQNAFFLEIGLGALLRDFPGTIMGISAGTMNCADTVYAQPEEPGESAPDFIRFREGLGLTNLNILPHYQQVKDNELDGLRLFEDITYTDSMDQVFFALVDGSFVVQDEDGQRLFGEAYRLENGNLWQICAEGKNLPL